MAQTNKPRSLAGCYSDLTTTGNDNELIVGSGDIVLKKKGTIYQGTFQQLRNDGGEGFAIVPPQHLLIDEIQKTISFFV